VLGEVITAIVTPFDSDGAVNYDEFRELLLHLADNGSDGFLVFGTTGESPTLSDDEKLELLRVAIDTVGDRSTVLAGSGTNSTEHSVHLTEQAHEVGADGFVAVTPYYNKPPARGLVEHFKAIAAATDRRPAPGDRQARRRPRARRSPPDAARRDRHGQDGYPGLDDRADQPADAGAGPQQDARRPALRGVPRVLPG
jgi:hypothetical protein